MLCPLPPFPLPFECRNVMRRRVCRSAKNIKNEAKRNEDVNEQLIRQLREEIEALRKALEAAKTGGPAVEGPTVSDADRAKMEEMIANLERAKQQSWCVVAALHQRVVAMVACLRVRQCARVAALTRPPACARREEKERLSRLFQEEREKNLANENKIKSVMQVRQPRVAACGPAHECTTLRCNIPSPPQLPPPQPAAIALRRRSRRTTRS